VNPNIRDDELAAIESNRQQVLESLIRQAGVWMPCVLSL
jgi:ATP-dependent helicase HepA